ncbi:MAG TPA: LamG-like jellyroll fold domain-containing protein, partial [Solirubrobacteraceae bacterium]|nr:LamG-like jellyroll fold domain-containing protein [Solirubrobacteraceae bacterium]
AVADASGLGNNGTATATGWAPMGRFGGALSFNGSSSWVTVPDSASLDLTTGMTLEAWVNPTTLGGGWRTTIFKHSPNGMVYSLYGHNGSRPTGQVNIGGEQNAVGSSALPINTWTHLAVTYDGSTLRLYVNGSQVASRAQTGAIPVSSGVLRIGGNSIWTEYYAGLIDEVRVYGRALTAGEIQSDMTTPIGQAVPDTQAPTAPGNLRQTGATATTATIAWNASSDDVGVAGYGLYRSGGPAGSTGATTATIGGLTCGASEVVGVDAYDAATNRSGQSTIMVTAEDCPPDVDFVNERVILDLDAPTALAFTPDGRMLIAERDGVVRVAQPGASQVDAQPILTIPSVAHDNERGLLGITLDPAFAQNGYVYAFYTHGSTLRNRVSRFRPDGSEQVIWQNSAASTSWHQGGDLQFGPDGFLYVSVGDHLSSGTAQQLSSFNGKILRMAADGAVPVDNPFYDGSGPNADAVWARGLRNPFRFTIDHVTGRMIIGDVGEGTTEEVNVGARGANFGWPSCEGSCGSAGMTNPVHAYPHGGRDASVTGGFVYRGTQFPAAYRGDYFFADYAQNWIKRMSFDAAGNVTGVYAFEPPDGSVDGPYGDIVDLAEGPDGSLWYVDAGPFERGDAGSIRRIRDTGANRPPTAVAAADRTSGPAPLTVQFSSAGSDDPEDAPLGYYWDFGDGQTSTEASPSHSYQQSGRYTARLTTSDGVNETLSAPIVVTVGSAPTARITAPDDGSGFRAGDVITFSGEATDPDDGALSGASLTWKVVFHHDDHIHPTLDGVTGSTGTLTVPDSGHSFVGDTDFEIVLTATDADGIQASDSIRVEPQKATIALATAPAGLGLTLDGISRTAPFSQDEAIGFRYTVGAPSPQVAGADRYTFASWSDGGAQTHAVTVPPAGLSLTAAFDRGSATLPGLVAAYSFDAGSGPTLADRSGRGHPGTITGATWAAAGRNAGALSFDGINDSVRVADHADLDLTSAMTLEAWVRPSTLGSSWRTVLFKEQTSHMTYALYAAAGDGRPTGQAWVGGERDARATSAIPTASWTHLAVTYDGSAVRLYVNGAPVRTLATTGSMAVSSGPLKLGGNAIWAEWFAGLMDDVRVYGRALSQAEIQSDMSTPVG